MALGFPEQYLGILDFYFHTVTIIHIVSYII
jgi:hypothetical protein